MSASAAVLILLNATSPVNSCHFCHCGFQPLSLACLRGECGEGEVWRGGTGWEKGESEKRKTVEHQKE